MTHNTLYERFVDQGDNQVQGYIAYGLYKSAKREWVINFKAANGRDPNAKEIGNYVQAYTEQTIEAFETQAAGVLVGFADGAIGAAKADIVAEALRGSFWGSVWQSIAANAVYTLILIALVLILAFAGVDLLGLFAKVAS